MFQTRTLLLLTTAGAFALAGCTDPANLPNGAQKTQEGAIIGGVVGGLAGLATAGSNPTKSALLGAAAGAAAGGLIGNRLDQQEAALRQSINNSNIQIVNTGSELKVIMPQGILFATDSAAVNPSIYGDLGALATNLTQYPDSVVEVVGHTDNTGAAAYNQTLSLQRAQSVASILVSNGVPSNRLVPIGRGEDQPIASNLTEEGKAQNRRVEVIIRPTA
ncbi:putative lipoprotein YiaD precursor [Pseudoruegeria aquimaris]|uniref:Putative lipoprotein YiaD n=1 Tax=Pseudoruegeria aquimaris TaxID=393663 RepID=A0A1Y5S0V5_9RHOB|nr:OmpA family protein [Pseudoruegeria aquimaris]SLN29535.1 putative lipoprotein YiaD precursor [Pseudoruegeria aquimaris]